jgi:ABC-type transporter Mla MlaB component
MQRESVMRPSPEEAAYRARCASGVEERMLTTQPNSKMLAAPEHLGLDTRTDFRQQAAALLEELPERTGQLIIDLSATRQVDSAGLGALMLVQRRAAERRQAVVLRNANDELRFLLVLTKLDDLFQLESAA